MRLSEDGPIRGPKHIATIKQNQYEQFGWFTFIYCCVHGQISSINVGQYGIRINVREMGWSELKGFIWPTIYSSGGLFLTL
jgi:hypothetical protein